MSELVGEPRGQAGVGLAAIIAAAGWALTLVALSRGLVVRPLISSLVPGVPLGLVGTLTALAAWKKKVNVAVWVAVMVAAAFVVNLVLVWLVFHWGIWGALVSPSPVWGQDFRDGLYDPARVFSVQGSGWPPFTLLLGKAYTLLPYSTAYGVQVVLIVCAGVGASALSAVLAMALVPGGSSAAHRFGEGQVDAQSLGMVLACWLLTSNGMMYELWRGNVNVFALLFALLAVWLTIRLPRSPWWPAVALAVSINLKLYPVILVVLLFWRYRLRALVPVLVTNAVLLLVAGPVNLARMARWVTATTPGTRIATYGDMGAAGTAAQLLKYSTWAPSWIAVPLFVVPVALWTGTAWLVIARGWSRSRAVLLAAASITPMAVIPTLSNEYKLTLCVLPLAVLLAAFAGSRLLRGGVPWSVGFGVVLWLTFFLSRSSAAHGYALIGSKFSLLVIVQAMVLVVAWKMDPVPPGAEA